MSKTSWKTIIGLIVLVAGVVVGYLFAVPAVDIVAVAMIIAGAVTAIFDILNKDEIKGWKGWLFILLMATGIALLTLSGISGSVLESAIGGIIVILDIIFAAVAVKSTKRP